MYFFLVLFLGTSAFDPSNQCGPVPEEFSQLSRNHIGAESTERPFTWTWPTPHWGM